MRATPTGSASAISSLRARLAVGAAALGLLAAACQPEFQPYHELQELRIMGVRADKPWFGPGEAAVLDALVHNPDPEAQLSFAWSWCPLASASADGFQCQITEEQLAENGVPFLPYDLGTTPTVMFPYPTDPLALRLACESIAEQGNLPDFVPLPDCEKGFPVTVSLVLDDGRETIRAVKEMVLIYDVDDERNRNPQLGGFAVRRQGEESTVALLPEPTVLARVERGADYRLEVDIPSESSEPYTPSGTEEATSESLVVTWFVEGGELAKTRTSYFPGESELESAEQNDWVPPSGDDFEDAEMRVYTVLRDGRGGIDWIASRLSLE
jgi:hypothetical protein